MLSVENKVLKICWVVLELNILTLKLSLINKFNVRIIYM